MAHITDQTIERVLAAAPGRLEACAFAAGAFLLSAITRIPTLGRQSLWYDEIITANAIDQNWWNLVGERLSRGHFPTYFALLKALGFSGGSDAALRLPSAVMASAAAAVFTFIALRLGGRMVAIAAALLMAFVPNLIFYGQEARPYALLLLFLALLSYAQLELLAGRGRPDKLALLATVAGIGAALTIPAGIASVAIQHLAAWLVAARGLPDGRRRLVLRSMMITWGVIGIAALALLPSVNTYAGQPHGLMKWHYQLSPAVRIREAWLETYGFWVREDINRYLPSHWEVVPSLVFCGLIIVAIRLRWREPAIRYLAVGAIGTPLLYLLIGTVSVTAGRYMIGMLPPAILLAASGAEALMEHCRPRAAIGGLLAVAVTMLGLQALDASQSPSRFDWRQVAAFFRAGGIHDVEILTNSAQTGLDMSRYLPGDGIAYRFAEPPLQAIDEVWTSARQADPAWLLLFESGDRPPENDVSGRMVCRWDFGATHLWVLTSDLSRLPAPLRSCAAPSVAAARPEAGGSGSRSSAPRTGGFR